MTGIVRLLPADLRGRDAPGAPYPVGLAGVVVTIAMLFTAFTAALLVRRTGSDWGRVALPAVVWANTMVILLSSGALERARRLVRRGAPGAVGWLGGAAALGVLFLAGQVMAWRALAAGGVPLGINPHGAFFYMLSAVHAAHVLGGLGAVGFTLRRLAARAYGPGREAGLTHTAVYWHLVGAVWLWLLALLSTL